MEIVIALYAFDAQSPEELSFRKGLVLFVKKGLSLLLLKLRKNQKFLTMQDDRLL